MKNRSWLNLALPATMVIAGLFHGHTTAQTEAKTAEPRTSAATWELTLSPYTHHWSHDDAHRNGGLVALERIQPDASLWGAALFSNSFGQTSGYVYYGKQWDGVLGLPALYTKVTAGLMYGYRGKYKNKVPLNYGGFNPAIVPAIGYRITPVDALQVAMLGTAGLMFSYNRRF